MKPTLTERARQKVLVLDGAMGTSLINYDLPLSDYNDLENCSEILCDTRPDVVRDIHRSFLAVGCDAVETNTFGANKVVFAEFDLVPRVRELNRRAVELAHEAVQEFSTPEWPRYVIGSVGPGTRLPSIGHTTFDVLEDSYHEQALGLLDGPVDAILIETCQDILQAKAALAGTLAAFDKVGRKVPLMVQVTMETTGTMLVGTEIGAALAALEPYPIDIIGLNCATGPQEMSEHVAYLGRHCPVLVSVLPNAGLPQMVDGKPYYPLTPQELASWHRRFITEDGVRVVGGCCGTTPEHLKAVVDAVQGLTPKDRAPVWEPSVSSVYSPVTMRQDNSFLIIGERTNANGSRKFKRLLEEGDLDGMVGMAREQVSEGSHVIDVCTAYVGRDEVADMRSVLQRFATQVPAPLTIDSTEYPVIEEALKLAGGRCIVNSINLEDGEERMAAVLPLCRKYGAAVIALTIDEVGMAKEAGRKIEIAERMVKLAVDKWGMRPSDILIDPLTFTICTGNEDDRKLGLETLDALALLKERLPECHTLLGLSNISFGLKPAARHVINSVFLHHARERGLDAAIVHAGKIKPLFKIDERQRQVAEDLIYDRRREGYDPLQELLGLFENVQEERKQSAKPKTVEEALKRRIIDGDKPGLEADLDTAMQKYAPLAIINDILLDGMKVVGELFASGEMQLPFVLQSAETMKAAVAHLEPHMERVEGDSKGRVVLATVRGDVHDIGKNLVDIILTNNGYSVKNIGIKQPLNAILEAATEHDAHVIGMSGLLVKSTVIMKENLEEMNRQGIQTPVILGGAALTRKYVEQDLRAIFQGDLHYAKDAFDGLNLCSEIVAALQSDAPAKPRPAAVARPAAKEKVPATVATSGGPGFLDGAPRPEGYEDMPEVRSLRDRPPVEHGGPEPGGDLDEVPVPDAPFFGTRVVEKVPLKALLPFVNEQMLFNFQWGYRRGKRSNLQMDELYRDHVRPIYRDLVQRCEDEDILQPQAVYGFYPCNRDGDRLIVFDESGANEKLSFTFPRQRKGHRRCIADFFRPVEGGVRDVLGIQVVTVGQRASDIARTWFRANHYRDYLYLHGFSVEAAEALAEYVHRQVRADLGIVDQDAREMRQLLRQGYRGSRYSFGYPACPDLENQQPLNDLLGAERIGVTLTEEMHLVPEQTTSAIIVHHPQAKYFTV